MQLASWLLLPNSALRSVTITTLAFLSLVCTHPSLTVAAVDAPSASCGPSSRYVVAYYQTWKRQSMMNIDWSKISHVNVAHGIPTDSGGFSFDGEWFLSQLVRDAHKEQTKVSVSIGGWTGSNRLSTIMRDVHKRAALIRSIGEFIEKYELDGVDIDWEYVGRQGSKCNKFSATEDSANLLRFLRALRASLHTRFTQDDKLISLAVRVQPFDNADGPMEDVSPFAEYVDFASIMAFDINGVWSNTTGPNAPLENQRGRGAPYSLSQSVDQWLAAKWPAEKLIAGVSFLGRSLTTRDVITAKQDANMFVPFDRDIPQGDAEDARWYDVCENVNAMSGIWQYKHLRDQGILKTINGTADEWVRVWDEKTSTPWLYNPQMRRFISYDDPQSLQKKVEYVQQKNLKGMMAWGLHGDYNDELMDTLNRVGPLCRGPKIDTDHPLTTSSLALSSATSMWSPTAPFVFLPKTTAQSLPLSSVLHTLSSTLSSGRNEAAQSSSSAAESSEAKFHSLLASAQDAPAPSGAAAELNATPLSIQDSTLGPEFSSPMVTTKAILFDSIGAPYMMIGGTSTPVPFELAEKIMKIVEKTLDSADSTTGTATATLAAVPSDPMDTVPPPFLPPIAESPLTSVTDDRLPSGPVAIPVVDGVDKKKTQPVPSFNPPQWGMATNIFETHAPNALTKSIDSMSSIPKIAHDLNGPPSVSLETNAGFAATFFLTLDPNTPDSNANMGATTVIPFAQMMASARNEAMHGAPRTMALGVGAFSVSATISGASASAGFESPGDHFSLNSLVAIPIESSILSVGDSASAAAEPTLI